jgi:voltage-gated potassium channel
MLLVLLATIGILHLEDVPEANIKSAEDALWWTMETITTVGYGDKYPVTSEGRLLASGLMLAGVALIGIYTGYVASWFLRPAEADEGDRASRIDSLADALLRLSNDERAGLAARLGQVRDVVGPTS